MSRMQVWSLEQLSGSRRCIYFTILSSSPSACCRTQGSRWSILQDTQFTFGHRLRDSVDGGASVAGHPVHGGVPGAVRLPPAAADAAAAEDPATAHCRRAHPAGRSRGGHSKARR